jgi:REP element-mobilizing transposase RayT
MSGVDHLNTRRKHIRLDPTLYESGSFFVTICTRNRASVLGEVQDCQVITSPIGEIVKEEWLRTPTIRPGVTLGGWVIMPDHMHAVVHIHEATSAVQHLSALVRGFKGTATRRCWNLIGINSRSLWQRGYYERIVRDQEELDAIESCIKANPARWNCRSA